MSVKKLLYVVTSFKNGVPNTDVIAGNLLLAYNESLKVIQQDPKYNYNRLCVEFRKNSTAKLVLFEKDNFQVFLEGKYLNTKLLVPSEDDNSSELEAVA